MTTAEQTTPTEVGKVYVRLGSLSIGSFQTTRKDVEISEDVAVRYGVEDHRAIRAWKDIIKKGTSFGKINTAITMARAMFAENTWPFGKIDNVRMLPMDNYSALNGKMSHMEQRFWNAVDEAGAEWDHIVKISKESLNGAGRDEDYPTWAEVRKRFYFEYTTMPLPTGALMPVSVEAEDAKLIEADQANFENRIEEAFRSASKQLAKRVDRLTADTDDRLSNPKGLQQATLDNFKSELETLERLNLTKDADIQKQLDKVRNRLGSFSLEEQRAARPKSARKSKSISEPPAPAQEPLAPTSTVEQMSAFQKTLDAFRSLNSNAAA